MSVINLHGIWKLRCEARGIEVDYPVPGDVHSALIAAGQIPDPYKGMNELACRWVADEEWVAKREFEWSGQGDWHLDIDYLDTVTEVKINDKSVLKSDNCFLGYQPDVSKALRRGKNKIEIQFFSNVKEAAKRQNAHTYFVPYAAQNCPIPDTNFLRKPSCHAGWDWNLAIMPFGAYGRIMLFERSSAFSVSIRNEKTWKAGDEAPINIHVYFERGVQKHVEIEIEVAEIKRKIVREYDSDDDFDWDTISETIIIKNPKLWWPAHSGDQNFYEITVRFGEHVETHKIGLRQIELITDKNDVGARFAFKVNGKEVFCRGANWIPADALPSRATPELTRKLLQAAVDANMNMIRVWGGGYYEQDWFYDLCDELGLLVWQDFQFSCNLYPADETFLRQVHKEVQRQVGRLNHHPCVALWCGDNELIGALNWFPESRANRDRYLAAYDRLNYAIEQAAKSVDEHINWWPSSPSSGHLNFGDAWHDDRSGDMHFWSVWHEGKDFEHYRDVKPRFCSEFGFQSFPSMRICKQFVETEEDLNISSDVMEHHQRNKGGNARIAETMFRYFRFPVGFANFVYVSQIQHGLAMQTAVDYWRSLKPHCMGTLMWQLNDTWPVASWSGLDHDGGWKAMHHMAKDFYAPVSIVAIPDKGNSEIRFMAINDTPAQVAVTAEVVAVSLEDGNLRKLPSLAADVPSDRAIDIGGLRRMEDVVIFWSFNGIRRHFSFRPYKHLALPNPGLSHSADVGAQSLTITLSAQQLALHVMAECDVAGHFSGNVFDLLPGESRNITFTPDNPAELQRARDTLVIRDLYSSSH